MEEDMPLIFRPQKVTISDKYTSNKLSQPIKKQQKGKSMQFVGT